MIRIKDLSLIYFSFAYLNPRYLADTPDFESGSFGHSDTSPFNPYTPFLKTQINLADKITINQG